MVSYHYLIQKLIRIGEFNDKIYTQISGEWENPI